jgi:glycine hydroxymethyltransferase
MDKIFELIKLEEERQKREISLIPSENFASDEVRKALGSVLSNKYAEGYSGRRYYQGNGIIDEIENLAIERGKKLFGLPFINVQPYSGSPANAAIVMALVEPGEKICGLKLSAGGHLTHGHPKVTFSGKYYNSVQYDVDVEGRIDYDQLAELVKTEKPKLIFAGTTAYPYKFDWKKFREIADMVGAWLVADISHIAGLCVTGVHESPNEYVDVVMSTTHKMLRGPRGAIIGVTNRGLLKDEALGKKINSAVFPGLQGGPHMATIAAMAVVFEEDLKPEYKIYTEQVVKNAVALAKSLKSEGLKVFGTENHLMVVDCGFERGKEMAVKLEEVGIIVNANTIPHDTASPFRPSGIRIGTPAMTTKGWKEKDFEDLAKRMARIILEQKQGQER